MKNQNGFNKKRCALLGVVSALLMFTQVSKAGSYHSTMRLPTVFHKGYNYQVQLPVTGRVQPGARVSTVTWNWAYVGFPRGLLVRLCQGTTSNCLDVSRQRSGSTLRFAGGNPSQPLFFIVQLVNHPNSSPAPIGSMNGAVTVAW